MTPQDHWPLAWPHNEPLHAAMVAKGLSFTHVQGLYSYRDAEGVYCRMPVGFITYGPRKTYVPVLEKAWQANVNLPTGRWVAYYGPTAESALEDALSRAKQELTVEAGE